MNKNNQKLYYLMGTNMIAYLKSKGINEEYVEFTENKKVKYWFQDTQELYDTIREFENNTEIQEFVKQLSDIKKKVIELRNNNK